MPLPLFEHLTEIGRRITEASSLELFLNFDGTLAPLTGAPQQARLPPDTRAALRALARPGGVVLAVISGRTCADLEARLGIPGLFYLGNHGLEIRGPGCSFVEPAALECQEALREMASQLATRLRHLAGVWVEDRGLTVSVHYRQVIPDEWEEVRHLVHATLASASHPFVLTPGPTAYDIRPRVYWDRGTAVNWVREQAGRPDALVIYLGGDVADEDAFAALAEAVTVKVGNGRETAAHYQLADPEEVYKLLHWLAERPRRKAPSPYAGEPVVPRREV